MRNTSNFGTFAEPIPSTTSSSALPVDGALPPPCENAQYHGTLAHPREWRGRPNKRNWRRGVAARPGFSPSPNRGALLVNGGFLGPSSIGSGSEAHWSTDGDTSGPRVTTRVSDR